MLGELHGPISTGPKGNRLYLAYGTNRYGMLQILDREKLLTGAKEPTVENLLAPQIARLNLPAFIGAHTTLPVMGVAVPEFVKDAQGKTRDFVFVVNEAFRNECSEEPRHMAYVVDVTDEKNPFPVSNYQVAETSGNFCTRGGRFGAHASNENQPPMYARRILFFSWFNAGVRAVDIRDPYNPKEIGHYVPATNQYTVPSCYKHAGKTQCKTAIVTNNVEVDDRGYAYMTDRAHSGLHIIELTGSAREVAKFK